MNDIFSLKDKVAIVTGAGGLLGKRHCSALKEAGAIVIGCDIYPHRETDLKAGKGGMIEIYMDVTDKDAVGKVRDKIMNRFGRIDILVNNAAIDDKFEDPATTTTLSMFENYPVDLLKKAIDVNVCGVIICSQVFGTCMAAAGSGSIINVSSTYGLVGPDQAIYRDENGKQTFYKSASYPVTKGAITNFTRFLAAYWGHKNVRVNTLSPGGVENGQDTYFINNYSAKTLLNRMAKPSDYEGALIFLASKASAYMTGANLVVDGGWTAI